jgi:SAM-dependent methyltransferase
VIDFDGYTAELDYTSGYYRYLSPAYLRFATLNCGVPFPSRQPLRYLELGFGKGVSLNIHAAAAPGEYWGTDINPSHVEFAKTLAKASGVPLRILGLSFEELTKLDELPDFDVIVAHGVWSWISDASRRALVELLGCKLATGGIFYVSYNALPGCAALIPLQQLLRLHSKTVGQATPIIERLKEGYNLALKVKDSGGAYFEQTPRAVEWLDEIHSKSPVYLCHEYLGENWKPMSFSETSSMLRSCGLHFAGSADLLNQYDDLTVDTGGLTLLRSIADPLLRETICDLLVSQEFRRDIYVKSEAQLDDRAQAELLRATAFVLLVSAESILPKIKHGQIDLNLGTTPYLDIVRALAKDSYRNKNVAELISDGDLRNMQLAELIRGLAVLTAANVIAPTQETKMFQQARAACARLNSEILHRAQYGAALNALASPVAGRGVILPPEEMLFVQALKGSDNPSDWASLAWKAVAISGGGHIEAGRSLEGAKLLRQAMLFSNERHIIHALGIVDEKNAS